MELNPYEIVLNDFSLEIEFKSTTMNGILFYAYQCYDGSGDFISILIRNGNIEFRFKKCF